MSFFSDSETKRSSRIQVYVRIRPLCSDDVKDCYGRGTLGVVDEGKSKVSFDQAEKGLGKTKHI